MSLSAAATSPQAHLAMLLSFLEQDPDNLSLIADAANAALDAGDLATTSSLLDTYQRQQALTPALRSLRGVALLSAERWEEAAQIFENLLRDQGPDPATSFNLAWARGLLGDQAGVLEVIDPAVTAGVPRAAALKVQALHHLGQLDEALAQGQTLAEERPHDQDLAAALSLVATDAERFDLALRYGQASGHHPDGLATLGSLALHENRVQEALAYYDQALAGSSDNARALLGKGLGLLVVGDGPAASDYLTRSAARFGDHPGSWIAAAWAHYINSDLVSSRQAFERALAADENFAESHGGLAVLDAVEGQYESAKRRTQIALRLDRTCFSAALASSLIAEQEGDHTRAERIRQIALNAPLGPDGRTIASALVALDLAGRRGGAGR